MTVKIILLADQATVACRETKCALGTSKFYPIEFKLDMQITPVKQEQCVSQNFVIFLFFLYKLEYFLRRPKPKIISNEN